MNGAGQVAVGWSGIRLDVTVPSAQVAVTSPVPYGRDGRIGAWSLPSGQPLTVDLRAPRFVTDLTLRVYASQSSTLRVHTDDALAASMHLPAGTTRTLGRADLPGLDWTVRTVRVDATCPKTQAACVLVPELHVNLLPPRDPGADDPALPGVLICAAVLALAWSLLSPASTRRQSQ